MPYILVQNRVTPISLMPRVALVRARFPTELGLSGRSYSILGAKGHPVRRDKLASDWG